MSFDKTVAVNVGSFKIRYGIIYGNEKIVFIKMGAGSPKSKISDKYLEMAHRVNEKVGATVICSTNPTESVKADKTVILRCAEEMKITDYKLYFFGTSDGAYHNLQTAGVFPQTVKAVSVNPSWKEYDSFVELLKKLNGIEKIFVWGDADCDYEYAAKTEKANIGNLKIIPFHGADHDFTGMTEQYIALIDLI